MLSHIAREQRERKTYTQRAYPKPWHQIGIDESFHLPSMPCPALRLCRTVYGLHLYLRRHHGAIRRNPRFDIARKSCGAIWCKPASSEHTLTTYQTTFCVMPLPQTMSLRATARKTFPSLMPAVDALMSTRRGLLSPSAESAR